MKRLLFVALLVSAGCSGRIDAASFDQTCENDDDCTAVFSGDICEEPRCTCANAAINEAEREAYDEAFAALTCGPELTPVQCECAAAVPQCVNARCTTQL